MKRRYSFVIRSGFPVWALVATAVRLPNATAPLAMVFLGHGATGSYAAGGVLAAAFVIGEVGCATVLGWLRTETTVRRDVPVGLVVGALGFAVLTIGAVVPFWMIVTGAVLAGAGPAQSGGALRAALGRIVDEDDVARAYSIDSVITEIVWLVAPALVAAAAVTVSPYSVLGLNAVFLILAVLLLATKGSSLLTIDAPPASDAQLDDAFGSRRTLLRAWPVYLTSAAALSLMAVAELVLPALLEERGYAPGWAGVLLAVFAAASAIASVVYGLRKWRGSVRVQSTVFLVLTAAALGAVAVTPRLELIALALTAAGTAQAVVMITRNLALRDDLPVSLHTGGFTLMYSVQGAGYAVSAILASAVLEHSGAPAAISAGLAVMVLLTATSLTAEVRRSRRSLRWRSRNAP